MIRRNTIQKDVIFDAVRDMKSHVTAEEVYEHIKDQYPHIGKGTVYRNLSLLSEEGLIRHVEIPNGPDCYDFTLSPHYHLRCEGCGKVYDVDMDVMTDLENHIHDRHGIKFLGYDILFKGICRNCQEV